MTNTNKGLIIAAIIIILLAKPKKVKAERLITMNTNKAENLIKLSEGLFLKAYIDPVGIYTIGWGNIFNYTKNRPVQKGDTITKAEAQLFFDIHMQGIVTGLKKLLKVNVNENQFNALLSWVYNFNLQTLAKSTLLKLLNAGKSKELVANEFLKWNKGKVKGKLVVLPGLVSRRRAEADLFLT
jgi:GH24 family phage-related lysozyme (muramidase)